MKYEVRWLLVLLSHSITITAVGLYIYARARAVHNTRALAYTCIAAVLLCSRRKERDRGQRSGVHGVLWKGRDVRGFFFLSDAAAAKTRCVRTIP